MRSTTIDAFHHQDVPFERLVDALVPARRFDSSPLCQVLFVLRAAPTVGLRLDGLAVDTLSTDQISARCDLEVNAVESRGELHVSWLYDCALFDRSRIEQLARQYEQLLEAFPLDIARPVETIATPSLLE